jgi:hypothetical protein
MGKIFGVNLKKDKSSCENISSDFDLRWFRGMENACQTFTTTLPQLISSSQLTINALCRCGNRETGATASRDTIKTCQVKANNIKLTCFVAKESFMAVFNSAS